MSKRTTINVAGLIKTPLCISAEKGQEVFDKVERSLKDGENVSIDFDGVTMLISLFLNVAIGQLYGSFSEDEIRTKLQVIGLSEDDRELLKRVVDNAKRYYTHRQQYDTAWQDEGDEDE